MKKPDLVQYARACGLNLAGNKNDLQERLRLNAQRLGRMARPRHLVALDIGTQNMGFIRSELHPTKNLVQVTQWMRLSLQLPKAYDPFAYASCMMNAMEKYKIDTQETNVFIIERQTSTSSTWSRYGTPLSIQQCVIIEALIYSILIYRLKERHSLTELPLFGLTPRCVSLLYKLTESQRSLKKNKTVQLTESIIKTGSFPVHLHTELSVPFDIQVDSECIHVFENEAKKDDMSDAFLLSMAWVQFYLTTMQHQAVFTQNTSS